MKLEIFFDYACPYCYKGHIILLEVLSDYPELEIEWRPCEAHPRPETHGLHSDLCARGMYQAREQGVVLDQYHELMYRACLEDRADIEDLKVITDLLAPFTDSKTFYTALQNGSYQTELDNNNREAWLTEGFPAVPSLRLGSRTLDSIPNIGLTRDAIKQFIAASV